MGQFETSEGLFTFDTVYPLTVGTRSSIGSAHAEGNSTAPLGQNEYFWKLVSFIPSEILYTENREMQKILLIILLFISAIIGLGSWKLSMARYSKRQAVEEVRTLQGILPICMYCKEIRDDKGSWTQLEKYISEHSESDFSHGICEKCMAEKFGEDIAARVGKKTVRSH
jgi:hypothetical protein